MKGKPVGEVTAARWRRAVRQGRVEIAPQLKVQRFERQVERILRDIGFPEALVTDESCFSDFSLDASDYSRLNRQYDFAVEPHDGIADVAERLARRLQPVR